ncbi:hypothetical protein R3Q06_35205, partial [Rhodococcus erythropolis]|uniref:hypothetical protein n=1 Tax=Rhodococcus erythropolis TaxID=1833 RepID=UPI00294A2117
MSVDRDRDGDRERIPHAHHQDLRRTLGAHRAHELETQAAAAPCPRAWTCTPTREHHHVIDGGIDDALTTRRRRSIGQVRGAPPIGTLSMDFGAAR